MFINASCDIITIHPQTTKQIERDLRYIKTCGVLTSIAIDPEKKVGLIEKYLQLIDNIVIMSVYPGFGNQRFMESSLKKIRETKNIIKITK